MEIKNPDERNRHAFTGLAFFWLIAVILSATAYAKEPLIVFRIEGKDYEAAVQGLKEELEEEFSINEMIVGKSTSLREIDYEMKSIGPRLVVLMDNISITKYLEYQKKLSSPPHVPSVSILASFMDFSIKDLKNATGIFYEVPIVTSVVSLRAVLPSTPFDKIGVVHREFMDYSIGINKKYCLKEGIDIVSYGISNKKRKIRKNLKKGLKKLKRKGIDALWIPNDSMLVNTKLLKSVWIPFARKFRKPIIVGAEVLVNPKTKFGTFAVTPDHIQLGVQAGEIVFDVMDNNWQVENHEIEPPRSVYKVINLKQAKKHFHVDEDKLPDFVDKIYK